tara:strand:- start:513 stop:617 length:105 start_codon:yes stop_codon:yes gene_type:complete
MGITLEEIGFFTAIGLIVLCLIKAKLDEDETTNK